MIYELYKHLHEIFPRYAIYIDYTTIIHIAHNFEHHFWNNAPHSPSFRTIYQGPYEGRHGIDKSEYLNDYIVMEDDSRELSVRQIIFYDYVVPSFLDDLSNDIGTPSNKPITRQSHIKMVWVAKSF